MEEKRYTILKDGDFRISKTPSFEKIDQDLVIFFKQIESYNDKKFTRKELDSFINEVKACAKFYKIPLKKGYYYPYTEELFGLYFNRLTGTARDSLSLLLKNFNRLQDFLAGKVAEPA